jgi:phosphohistidine phosphatase
VKLYVMRHGPAEDQSDSGQDSDRALTVSGRDRTRSVAKALTEGEESPLHIATSPLVRAVQTAEIVAVATKLTDRGGTVETRRELAPGGNTLKLVDDYLSHGAKRVMVVGHEPDLSHLVGLLLGKPMLLPMEKAMVVGLHLADAPAEGRGKLRFILEPKALAWLDDGR